MKIIKGFLLIFVTLALAATLAVQPPMPVERDITVQVSQDSQYVGIVSLGDECPYNVRLLVLKHCPDSIANKDAQQVLEAANLASSKGLTIKSIGNFHIDKNGETEGMWTTIKDLDGLKKFVSQQMKVNAKPDDTFVIYTLGHGGETGNLMRLGQRGPLMKILAEAAEENDQRTLWWQTSCHAAANLPQISTLTAKQQELFIMTASSPAAKVSYFCTQGDQFKKIFTAMATNSKEIDPNQDGVITAQELKGFMVKEFGKERGELVFASNSDEPVFGFTGRAANRIPIIDRNSQQGSYPRNYIPIPKR